MIARRAVLGGFAAALAHPGLAACAATVAYASVPTFGRPGDRDDSAALARALASRRPAYLPAGGGSGTAGSYRLASVALAPGVTVFGDGPATLIRPSTPDTISCLDAESDGPARRIAGITLRDFAVEGYAATHGFREHFNLIRLNGVENALVERLDVRGFRGDGLYVGSGLLAGQERHNRSVVIRDCRFDGINRQNRNAISIIDVDGLVIEGCSFTRCSRPDMPGPIDIEPNADAFAIIRNIRIAQCNFVANGGNVAEIAMHIPAAVMAAPAGIEIIGNRFAGHVGSGFAIHLDTNRILAPNHPGMGIAILDNRGSGGNRVYSFRALAGIVLRGNEWRDYRGGSLIGYFGADDAVRDVVIADRFQRCGSAAAGRVAMTVFTVSGLTLDGTVFDDCGDGGEGSYAVSFDAGTSDHVALRNIVVRAPTGRTRQAIIREARHRFTPATNSAQGNDLGGLQSMFQFAGMPKRG